MNFRRAVFILVVFLLLSGIHLFVYARNISLKYEITDLKVKFAELSSRKRQLATQVAREENLNYVEKTAREKLKMVYPERVIYILPSKEAGPARN